MSFYPPYMAALTGEDSAERHATLTRRQAVSLSLLATALILVAMPMVPLLAALMTPAPFVYGSIPFPLSDGHGNALPRGEMPRYSPGETVPFLVSRCTTEPFDPDGMLPYLVSRNMVHAETKVKIILPSLATTVQANGCDRSETFAHAIPPGVAPGTYYLEGVATVYGRFRVANSYFWTDPFQVVP